MAGTSNLKRADKPVRVASDGMARARQGAASRMPAARNGEVRGALPTMQASARRCGPGTGAANAPRKPKRAKRAPGLGGRLAAAIRVARLRASRAAEEFGRRR